MNRTVTPTDYPCPSTRIPFPALPLPRGDASVSSVFVFPSKKQRSSESSPSVACAGGRERIRLAGKPYVLPGWDGKVEGTHSAKCRRQEGWWLPVWLWGPHPPSPETANRIRDDARGCRLSRKLSLCIRLAFASRREDTNREFKVLKRVRIYTYACTRRYTHPSDAPRAILPSSSSLPSTPRSGRLSILLRCHCENPPIFSGEKQLALRRADHFTRYIINNRIKL